MKKINFEVIKKIDLLLFLIGAILGCILLILAIIDSIPTFHIRTQNTQMEIVEDPKIEIKEYISFSRKIKDTYVFAIRSSGIRADGLYETEDNYRNSKNTSYACYNSIKSYDNDRNAITNFIFIKDGEKEEYRIFPPNTFIYKYQLMRDNRDYPGFNNFNIYAVIKEDTNHDKVLDSADDIALYVSDYDGRNIKEISTSIMTFDNIDKDEFLFTEYDGTTLSYFSYNGTDCKKKLLKSVKQEIKDKSLDINSYR